MAKRSVSPGVTSRIEYVFIQDSASTTGAGKTGLLFNTAGWKAYYVRPGAVATAITLATQTVTGAFSSGGFVEVDATNMPGVYRIDVPDAVFAAGVDHAIVMLSGPTGVVPLALEYDLTNPTNFSAFSITAAGSVTLRSLDTPNAHNGTAQAGGASTITLAAGASALDNFYVGMRVRVYSGTGTDQSRTITGYVGATKVATVDRAWVTNPDNTSLYSILAAPGAAIDSSARVDVGAVRGTTQTAGDLAALLNTIASYIDTEVLAIYNRIGAPVGASIAADIASVQADTDNIQTRIPAALVGGRMDSSVGAMQANTLTAAALATDAVDEIVAAVWALAGRSLPAAERNAIADAILTRLATDTDPTMTNTGRNLLNAMRFLRNGFDAVTTPGSVKILGEDGTTVLYTLTLSSDPTAQPITGAS